MTLRLVTLRTIDTAVSSMVRAFRLENKHGVALQTPVYAVDAYQLISPSAPITIEEVEEKQGAAEVSIQGQSSLATLRKLNNLLDSTRAEVPYYIVFHPASTLKLPAEKVEDILKEIEREASGLLMFVAIETSVVKLLAQKRPLEKLCGELHCAALIYAATRREAEQKMNVARQLWEYNILTPHIIVAALMRSSLLSQRRRRITRVVLGDVMQNNRLLVTFGSRRHTPLRGKPFIGIAEDILQYHFMADIVGPPRSPSRGYSGDIDKSIRRLLVTRHHFYYNVEDLVNNYGKLKEEVIKDILKEAGIGSFDELHYLTPARVNEINTRHKLVYSAYLRSLDDPSSVLNDVLTFWRNHGFSEALRKVEQALADLRNTYGIQRGLSDYIKYK